MHTYKDAIPNTVGAYIIYPGINDKIYYENDKKLESVGAFGLIPGQEKTDKIAVFIKNLIAKIARQYPS